MNKLPPEILEIIVSHLPLLDIISLRQCSREFRAWVNDCESKEIQDKLESVRDKNNYIRLLDRNVIYNNLDVIGIGINHACYISDEVWIKTTILAIMLQRNKIVKTIISRSWWGISNETRIRSINNDIQLPIHIFYLFMSAAVEMNNKPIAKLLILMVDPSQITTPVSYLRLLKEKIVLTAPLSPAMVFINKILAFINSEIVKGRFENERITQVRVMRFIEQL